MLKCLEGKVKWWKIVTDRMHILLSENNCHEHTPGVYGESDTGEFEAFNTEMPCPVTWDYSKLPDHELLNVSRFITDCNVRGLIVIHNQYGLSAQSFCCDNGGIVENFKEILKLRGYAE